MQTVTDGSSTSLVHFTRLSFNCHTCAFVPHLMLCFVWTAADSTSYSFSSNLLSCIAGVSRGMFGINTVTFVSSAVKHRASSVHGALKQSSYSLCNPSDRLSGLYDVLMVIWAITQNNSHCILSRTCCKNRSKIPDLTDTKHKLHWLFIRGRANNFYPATCFAAKPQAT